MELKEKLKALGVGVSEALILTLLAIVITVTGVEWVVTQFKPEYVGIFANILGSWVENPLIVGAVAGGIRSLFGWLQNFWENGGEEYDASKLTSTWFYYMALITALSQGLGMGMSVGITVLADVIVRAIKAKPITVKPT